MSRNEDVPRSGDTGTLIALEAGSRSHEGGTAGAVTPSLSRARRRRKATRSPRSQIIVTGVLAIVALYFLVPLYWVIVAATKTTGALFGTNGFWFGGPFNLFTNIGQVLSYDDGIFLRWTLNSLLYSGVGAVLATYFAAAGGYALAKYEFRGRQFVFGLILGGVLVPGTATALPLFLLFSAVGLTDSYWSVLLPSLVSPFGLFLCRVYAQAAIDDALLESGRIDGADEVRIFHSIALRQMTPALVTVFLFQALAIWNNYFLPLVMLADQNLYPITLGLNNWLGQVTRLPEFYQLTTAGVLISVIPLAIAVIVLQRFWRGGLTEGSIKG